MLLLRALHWIIAAGLFALLWLGFVDGGMSNLADPRRLMLLRWHMAGGMAIFALTLLRIGTRLRVRLPRNLFHYSLYALVIAMAATGFATAVLSGLNAFAFGGVTPAQPIQLPTYPTWFAHRYIGMLLAGLIAAHVLTSLRKRTYSP